MGTDFKLGEFCVLMHFYFIRIGIMEKKSRQPFSTTSGQRKCSATKKGSLQGRSITMRRVMRISKGPNRFKGVKFNFEIRPNPSGKPIYDAFHEVGYIFHHSHDFVELRKLRKQMNEFGFSPRNKAFCAYFVYIEAPIRGLYLFSNRNFHFSNRLGGKWGKRRTFAAEITNWTTLGQTHVRLMFCLLSVSYRALIDVISKSYRAHVGL